MPTSDPRFADFQTDPRYRLPKRKETHTKIDPRFAARLRSDADFSSRRRVDRYGRKLPKDTSRKELERLYDFGDQEGEDDDVVQKELDRLERQDEPKARKADLAKYQGYDESSSSEEETSSSEEEESDEEDAAVQAGLEGFAGDAEDQVEDTVGEPSSRLAVQDIDWDHIRAVDLMAVAQSFCPEGGRIERVSVYPSEFGRERMEREEFEGPPKELFKKSRGNEVEAPTRSTKGTKASRNLRRSSSPRSSPSGEDSDEDEHHVISDQDDDAASPEPDDEALKESLLAHAKEGETEIDTKALRAYQLTRLRYYYAIIECSSTSSAQTLYTSMDNTEYLSTANYFRLSFVPDSMSFSDDTPRDTCTRVPPGYRPADFVTEALTHSNVKLTWDEEDRTRKEAQKRAFAKGKDGKNAGTDDDDLAAYVGSDSDSDAEEDGGVPLNSAANTSEVQGENVLPPKDQNGTSSKLSKRDQMRLALNLPIEDAPSKSGTTGTSKSPHNSSKPDPIGPVQITFSSALSDPSSSKPGAIASSNNNRKGVFLNSPEDVREESTRERYIRKEKERKARRKEKSRGVREDGDVNAGVGAGANAGAGAADEHVAGTKNNTNDKTTSDSTSAPKASASADTAFSDPFFTDPAAANTAAKKEAKRLRRAERAQEARAEEERKAKERKELEMVMRREDGVEERDFDIREIRRREKEVRRVGRGKGKEKGREGGDGDGDEGGEKIEEAPPVDVKDPRFKGLFEDFEYAIDPSNPRYSGTDGMRRLLEEGRKRRKGGGVADDVVDREGKSVGRKRGTGDEDVGRLVEKVKRRRVK